MSGTPRGSNIAGYRYSLRSLFVAALACSSLLLEWKHWGFVAVLGTVITLACGAVCLWYLTRHPAAQNRSVVPCALLSIAGFVLLIAADFWWVLFGHSVTWEPLLHYWTEIWQAFYFTCLLIQTALVVMLIHRMQSVDASCWLLLLIVFNLGIGYAAAKEMTHRYHDAQSHTLDLLQGYGVAVLAFAIALALRWIGSLPTSSEDLPSDDTT